MAPADSPPVVSGSGGADSCSPPTRSPAGSAGQVWSLADYLFDPYSLNVDCLVDRDESPRQQPPKEAAAGPSAASPAQPQGRKQKRGRVPRSSVVCQARWVRRVPPLLPIAAPALPSRAPSRLGPAH